MREKRICRCHLVCCRSNVICVSVAVNHRQLRSELRTVQGADGHMGHTRRAAADVHGPEDHQTRVQGDFAEQEDHSRRPRQVGNPRPEDLQGRSRHVISSAAGGHFLPLLRVTCVFLIVKGKPLAAIVVFSRDSAPRLAGGLL